MIYVVGMQNNSDDESTQSKGIDIWFFFVIYNNSDMMNPHNPQSSIRNSSFIIHHSPSPKSGFTLLELLTVVGIMVLIVGISYPLFSIWQETVGVKKGLQVLNQTISLAKNMAVTKKIVHYLLLDKDKSSMQIYMENTGNQTLDVQTGQEEQQGTADSIPDSTPPVYLPKQVGFYTNVSLFRINPSYLGFIPEGALLMPQGIQLRNKEKFMDDPKGNADLGLIFPIDNPYKCIYIKLGRTRGGIDESTFDKCDGTQTK